MMQNLADIATAVVRFMHEQGLEWEGYGQPNQADVQISLAAMIDYTDSTEERTLLEIPATGLQIIRDGDTVEVWLKVGVVDAHDSEGQLPGE